MQKTFQAPLKYSQNFITSSSLIEKLVKLSGITKSDTVLEIGGGKGIITEELAKVAGKVVCIEKDRKLFEKLKDRFNEQNTGIKSNVDLIPVDFLQFDLNRLGKYKVFSNIPFSISAEIIKKLLYAKNPPVATYLFLSEDVMNKFTSRNSKETLSSLTTKPFYRIKILHRFSRQDFDPVPSVNVFFVEFKPLENPSIPLTEINDYVDFITYSFNQWKPNIKLSLRKIFSHLQLKIISQNVGFRLESKPSEITLEQWIQIYNDFKKLVPPYKRNLIYGAENKLATNQKKMRKSNLNYKFRRPR